MDDICDALPERCPLATCGAEARAALARRWSELWLEAGTAILSAEDESRDVYFLLSGTVRATIFAASGREVGFSELGPGALFGEIAAIDGGPRSASVIATGPVRLGRVAPATFRELIDSVPELRWAILAHLAERVRALSSRMLDVTTMNARERLIAHLLSRAEPTGTDAAAIGELPTQQALADAILGQREAVGREMSRLQAAGLVRREGRRLEIPSVAALRAELLAGAGPRRA